MPQMAPISWLLLFIFLLLYFNYFVQLIITHMYHLHLYLLN